jgi:hypothetical protein
MQYWFVVVRRRWMILLAVALSVAATAFVTVRQPKLYLAASSFILEESSPRVVDKVQDVNEPTCRARRSRPASRPPSASSATRASPAGRAGRRRSRPPPRPSAAASRPASRSTATSST